MIKAITQTIRCQQGAAQLLSTGRAWQGHVTSSGAALLSRDSPWWPVGRGGCRHLAGRQEGGVAEVERRGRGRGRLRHQAEAGQEVSDSLDSQGLTNASDDQQWYGHQTAGEEARTGLTSRALHQPVMLNEVLSFFAPQQNQVFVDMTFGGGGHTRALLNSAPGVKVYALDRDPQAHVIADELSQSWDGSLVPMLGRFSELQGLLAQRGLGDNSVDGILIDAGCSSFQFDSPERGFSLSQDGPLDMRMDSDRYPNQPTAADVINSLDHSTLTQILRTYGEESNAKKIAQAIVDYRTHFQPFTSTQELATVVACCHTHRQSKSNRDKLGRRAHTATKTFLALRIFVNNELNELAIGLEVAGELVKSGGKLAVLSFHSLEDRVVKRSLQGRHVAEKGGSLRQKRLGSWDDGEVHDGSCWRAVGKKVLPPDETEVESNPRARSAKLRTAIKV